MCVHSCILGLYTQHPLEPTRIVYLSTEFIEPVPTCCSPGKSPFFHVCPLRAIKRANQSLSGCLQDAAYKSWYIKLYLWWRGAAAITHLWATPGAAILRVKWCTCCGSWMNECFCPSASEQTDYWTEEQHLQLCCVVFLKIKINAGSYEEALTSLKNISLNAICPAIQL